MDDYMKLFDLIGELARHRYQSAEKHFSEMGFNHTEARLLTLLNKEGGRAAQDNLSGMIYVDRSNVGRALKRLEQDGYVKRNQDVTDKRTNFVQMTQKGEKAVNELSKIRKKMVKGFFGSLTKEEARQTVKFLGKVFENG